MKNTDVLIVGQGLAGTMLAFELYFAGVDFIVVNNPVKSAASQVAAGMVNPLVFKRMTKSWMVDELLPVMKKRYRKLEELLGEKLYFELPIIKPLSEQEAKLWHERKDDDAFKAYLGNIVKPSPVKFIQEAHSYGIVKGAGYLKINRFLALAKRFLQDKGVLMEADLSADRCNFRDGIFEDISFNKIVFCEGHYLKTNPLFNFVRLQPAKGEVLQIYAPGLTEEYILNKRVFVLPIGGNRFKVGSTYQWKDIDDIPTENGRNSIIERLKELIDVDFVVEQHWAGVRPTVVDRRPVLGQHPEFKAVYLFNGLGTKGVMLAPYFAKQMKDLFLHSDYSIDPQVDLFRFLHSQK